MIRAALENRKNEGAKMRKVVKEKKHVWEKKAKRQIGKIVRIANKMTIRTEC
jgi:hypothetical protein